MKKSIALLAVCATALSPMLATPAFAQAAPTPIAQMQTICAMTTIVNPDPNSTFAATLNLASITSSVGNEFVSFEDVIEDIPGVKSLA